MEGYRMLVPFSTEDAFVQFLRDGTPPPMPQQTGSTNNIPTGTCQLAVNANFQNRITTKTKVFRVTSVGSVGNAQVTIEAVYDFSSSAEGKTLYWRID